MPFLGFATASDLQRATTCTQVVNGVDVCSVAKYDKVYESHAFQVETLLDTSAKACVHINNIFDVIEGEPRSAFEGEPRSSGRIPDNYVCFDGSKTSQYLKVMGPVERYLGGLAKEFPGP